MILLINTETESQKSIIYIPVLIDNVNVPPPPDEKYGLGLAYCLAGLFGLLSLLIDAAY